MVTHRRTPSRSNLVLPGWFFLVTAVVSVVAAVALAVLVVRAVDDGSSPRAAPTASPSTPATTETASPSAPADSPSPTSSPTPTATTSPTPSATPVDRSQYSVVVLNGTTTPNLASIASARVQQIGWPSAGVGNWRGAVPATTVYYPTAADAAAARTLAADLGVGSVAPSLAGMNTQRLTVVVLSRIG